MPLWLKGLFSTTVKIEFNRKTPWVAQIDKSPLLMDVFPMSDLTSFKIFFKEGGILIPSFTEKAKPFASL